MEKRPMIRTGCMWTVYCKRQRLSREEEHQVNLFFGRGSGKREAWPPVAFRDAMPDAAATLSPFPAYLARRGDCGGIAANPAHCQSDPVNFYAITRNLKEKPVVFLGSGYNYGDKQHAWGSAKSSLLQNTTLWCVWQAGAKAIGILERPHLSQENLFQNDNWLPNGFNVIPQAIFSPPSMGAITWGPANCKAQILSPVLANLRSKVDDYIERLAGAPPISAYTAVKSNKGFILFALRAPLASTNNNDDHRRLEKENPGRRSIHNFAQLIDATKRKWPDLEIRVHLFSESTSYPLQVALWRRARIVVGLHGGALSGSLWLSPGQGLLEITPREKSCGFPGMFAHVTAAVGARYHGILCQSCSMRNGGFVDENLFIETLSSLLQKTTTPSLHHKNQ
uniref:Glycosyltransferase 61 catalytic domain-containing protein n=1 Tax=Aureoumbra lagunensis TaxID=44058 RepID=A0A7S3JV26_9STRA